MSSELQKAIDDTAIKLLQKATGEDNAGEGAAELLIEQVKAFSAVVDWYKIRVNNAPPEPKDSKFAGIKRSFAVDDDSAPPERPRGRGRPKGSRRAAADPGTDSGSAASSPSSDADGADSA